MTPQSQITDHRKPCTLCNKPRDVLVRCQIDETETWHFVCPGSCWRKVSGGEIDGDQSEEHKWYRYGGMWKNKHEAVSAKKPKKKKKKNETEGLADKVGTEDEGSDGHDTEGNEARAWDEHECRYTKNDIVLWNDRVWICRKSHISEPGRTPDLNYSAWKEVD